MSTSYSFRFGEGERVDPVVDASFLDGLREARAAKRRGEFPGRPRCLCGEFEDSHVWPECEVVVPSAMFDPDVGAWFSLGEHCDHVVVFVEAGWKATEWCGPCGEPLKAKKLQSEDEKSRVWRAAQDRVDMPDWMRDYAAGPVGTYRDVDPFGGSRSYYTGGI